MLTLSFGPGFASHFFRQLTSTSQGCDLLREKSFIKQYAVTIKNARDSLVKTEYMLDLKSALWAIGNIGSTALGIRLLNEEGIISDIIYIATNSHILSLRGYVFSLNMLTIRTSFFVLGIIAKNPEGADILEEFGWESVSSSGEYLGMCLPLNFNKLLEVRFSIYS